MRVRKPKENFKLAQANVILAFDYQTQSTVRMQLQTLAMANVHLPAQSMSVSASKIRMTGTLKFKQTAPIDSGIGQGIRNTYNDDFFDQLEFFNADSLMHEYVSTRNETTWFDFTKMVQYSAATDSLANFIEIEILIAIPKTQNIIYVPKGPYVLKMGWVQYFYALVFWYIVLEKGLLNYLVSMRVFDCTEVNELNVKNINEEK